MKKRKFQNRIISELLNNCTKIESVCGHFLACGGCSYQDFSHKDQVSVKKDKIMELFGDLFSGINVTFQADRAYEYRTRMDYIVSSQGFGLRRKRRFDQVVDLRECHLISNGIFQFLRGVYEEGINLGLIPYDLQTHEGFWRYLSVRVNEKNDFMVVFNTTSDEDLVLKVDELVEKISNYTPPGTSELRITNYFVETLGRASNAQDNPDWSQVNMNAKHIGIKSIHHLINDSITDDNFGKTRKYWGEEYLNFDINGLKISIGPNTFFQNNIELLNNLIEKLLGYINPDDRVLDLYCGVGTLSLPVAKKAGEVLGVELLEESIEMAKVNAKRNNIDNVGFEVVDVLDFLNNGIQLDNFSTLLLDPPRKGLEKSVEKILENDFDKIVYMSCNPLSLKKDLEILTKKYKIIEASWWDLYPQTPHVEGLVYLERITND